MFKEIFLEKVKDENWKIPVRFNPYSFWLLCSDKQRELIPKSFIQKISDMVAVIVKGENGKYLKQICPVWNIMQDIQDQWYIDINPFLVFENGHDTHNFSEICTILNGVVEGTEELYIADAELERNERSTHWIDQVQIVSVANHKPLICYTFKAEQGSVQVLENQRHLFLRGLRETIFGCSYSRYYRNKKAKRYAIPALKGYETIAVKNIPSYIMGYPDKLESAWIVSPFVREDLENYKKLKLSKEAFAEQILNAKNFSWVVNWVQKNHLGNTTPTQAEITCCYRKLIYAYCEALEKTKSDKAEHKPNDPGECV